MLKVGGFQDFSHRAQGVLDHVYCGEDFDRLEMPSAEEGVSEGDEEG